VRPSPAIKYQPTTSYPGSRPRPAGARTNRRSATCQADILGFPAYLTPGLWRFVPTKPPVCAERGRARPARDRQSALLLAYSFLAVFIRAQYKNQVLAIAQTTAQPVMTPAYTSRWG
jgi:hypothetical protein